MSADCPHLIPRLLSSQAEVAITTAVRLAPCEICCPTEDDE